MVVGGDRQGFSLGGPEPAGGGEDVLGQERDVLRRLVVPLRGERQVEDEGRPTDKVCLRS